MITKNSSSLKESQKSLGERTWVVHVHLKAVGGDRREIPAQGDRSSQWRLEEAISLAHAIDLDVRGSSICVLSKSRPSTLFGKGWVDLLGQEIRAHEIQLLYVDAKLSPIQQRNLETALQCKVIDRTALILEIFGRRAQTSEGRLQVELAALQYQKSRLVRSWTHLERQRGGFGFMGGPGESQLELDRRMLGDRIIGLQKDLAKVQRTRTLQRKARQKVPFPVVALVGYTNAGKSTLFNYLSKADVFVADLLFATLDPTLRQVALPSGRKVIVSDTVGFISDLPTPLIAAFRATLEEVVEADLLLHVRDITHPSTHIQKNDVESVLAELGRREDQEIFEIWNKVDTVSEEAQAQLTLEATASSRPAFLISALSGKGTDALLDAIESYLQRSSSTYRVEASPADGQLIAWLYEKGTVVGREDRDDQITLTVVLSEKERARAALLFPQSLFCELTKNLT